MYEKDYVKKRKRKRAAAIIIFVGTVGCTALGIVAFLGRFVGTFTVSLNNGNVNLALSQTASFEKSESLLRVDTLPEFEETAFEALPPHSELDNENTDYLYGARYDGDTMVGIDFFKYTFYLKNVGSKVARYDFKLKIVESTISEDGTNRYLDDTIRVMIYQDEGLSPDHDYVVYAKEAAEYNYLTDGTRTRREFITEYPKNNTEDETHPLAQTFVSPTVIAEHSVSNFGINEMKRYTVVTWLEGFDPQSDDEFTAPKGAKMKLGVEINAYEN